MMTMYNGLELFFVYIIYFSFCQREKEKEKEKTRMTYCTACSRFASALAPICHGCGSSLGGSFIFVLLGSACLKSEGHSIFILMINRFLLPLLRHSYSVSWAGFFFFFFWIVYLFIILSTCRQTILFYTFLFHGRCPLIVLRLAYSYSIIFLCRAHCTVGG